MKTSNFFTCPAGHHEELPYPPGQYSSWCEACKKQVTFISVPPAQQTAEQKERESEDIRDHIQRRFREYAETWDKARQGIETPLVATPKDEKQAAIIANLRTGRFPERHIAALPTMDGVGMATAREVDDLLNS